MNNFQLILNWNEKVVFNITQKKRAFTDKVIVRLMEGVLFFLWQINIFPFHQSQISFLFLNVYWKENKYSN